MFKKMIVAAMILGTLLGFGGGMETASAASHGFHHPPEHRQHFDRRPDLNRHDHDRHHHDRGRHRHSRHGHFYR